jgi:hypothetical protein
MWFQVRVYIGDWKTDVWFPRVPVSGDFVDVGKGECIVRAVQLRHSGGMRGMDGVCAIVHADADA